MKRAVAARAPMFFFVFDYFVERVVRKAVPSAPLLGMSLGAKGSGVDIAATKTLCVRHRKKHASTNSEMILQRTVTRRLPFTWAPAPPPSFFSFFFL